MTATKAMAIELAGEKIRVNAINPVAGETGMLHLFMGEILLKNGLNSFPLFSGRLSSKTWRTQPCSFVRMKLK